MSGSPPEVRVKICGLTREEDAVRAAGLGAAFLGFVFAESPRRADPGDLVEWLPEIRQRAPGVRTVGVFVRPLPGSLPDLVEQLGLDLIQVHEAGDRSAVPGGERPIPVPWIRAVRPDGLPAGHPDEHPDEHPDAKPTFALPGDSGRGAPYAWLVDTPSPAGAGGTGRTFDWSTLPPPPRSYRLFLAGGLSPTNIAEAVTQVRPFAVDASSRLEAAPGRKDPARLAEFFRALRGVARVVPTDAESGKN